MEITEINKKDKVIINRIRLAVFGIMQTSQLTYPEFLNYLRQAFNIEKKTDSYLKACFDLALWQRQGGTNFTSKLYSLINKADVYNKEHLRQGFPVHVAAYESWYNSEDGEVWVENALEEYDG